MGEPQSDLRNALVAGAVVGEYQVEALLGHGGFSVVYRARHVELGRVVALKEYFPSEIAVRDGTTVHPRSTESSPHYYDGRRRFLEEARRLVEFKDDPGVVECLGFFRANGTAYTVLEHVNGMTLAELLRRREGAGHPLDEKELRTVVLPVLETLSRLHKAGVLHRDIKPSNILIRRPGGRPVLIDFGAAKQHVAQHTKSFAPHTPGYAAFEQVGDGDLGPWTDVYAIGAVMWRVVAGGKPPWEPPNPKRVEVRASAVLTDKSDPLPSATVLGKGRFSPGLLVAIDECLKIRGAERVRNCDDLRRLIKSAETDGHEDDSVDIGALSKEGRRSKAREWLRILKAAPAMATNETAWHLHELTDGLDERQMYLLTLRIFMDDLYEDVKRKLDIPLFESREEFLKEYKRLNEEWEKPKHAELHLRLRRRRHKVRDIAKRMHAVGLISQEALRRNYFRHPVVEYLENELRQGTKLAIDMNLLEAASQRMIPVLTGIAKLKKPRWAKRQGTELAIDMNLLEVLSQWMIPALTDIETAKAIKRFQESGYNIRDKVLLAIKQHNRAQRDKLIEKEFAKHHPTSNVKTWGEALIWIKKSPGDLADLPVFDTLYGYYVSLGRMFGTINKVLNDYDPDVPPGLRNSVATLAGWIENPDNDVEPDYAGKVPPWPALAWMAQGGLGDAGLYQTKDGKEHNIADMARETFWLISQRQTWLKSKVYNWLNYQNLDTALKGLPWASREEFWVYRTWQPDKGNLLYTAITNPNKMLKHVRPDIIGPDPAPTTPHDCPDEMLERVRWRIGQIFDKDRLWEVDPQFLLQLCDSLREQTMMGGSYKYQMVMHIELAETLDTFREKYLDNQVNWIYELFATIWSGVTSALTVFIFVLPILVLLVGGFSDSFLTMVFDNVVSLGLTTGIVGGIYGFFKFMRSL